MTATEPRTNVVSLSSAMIPNNTTVQPFLSTTTSNPTITSTNKNRPPPPPTSAFSTEPTSQTKIGGNEMPSTSTSNDPNGDDLDSMHIMLEPHLRPVKPDKNSEISKQIFEQHKQLANAYLKVNKFIFICSFFEGKKIV